MHRKNSVLEADVGDSEEGPAESSQLESEEELDEEQDEEKQDEQVLNSENMEEIISSLSEWRNELTERERAIEEKERLLESRETRLGKIKEGLYEELKQEHKENHPSLEKDDDVIVEEERDDPEKMRDKIKLLKRENRKLSAAIAGEKELVESLQEQLSLVSNQIETRNKLKKGHKFKMQEKEQTIEEEKKKREKLEEDLKSQEQIIRRLQLEHQQATKVLRSDITLQDERKEKLVSRHEEQQLRKKIVQMEETISELKLENSALVDIIKSFDSQPVPKAEKVEEKENQVSREFEESQKDEVDQEELIKREEMEKFIEETETHRKLSAQDDDLGGTEEKKQDEKLNIPNDVPEREQQPKTVVQIESEEQLSPRTYQEERKQLKEYLAQVTDDDMDDIYEKASDILTAVKNAKINKVASDETLANALFLTNQFLRKIISGKENEITKKMYLDYQDFAKNLNRNPLHKKIGGAMLAFAGSIVMVFQLPFAKNIKKTIGFNIKNKGNAMHEGTRSIAESSVGFINIVESRPKGK